MAKKLISFISFTLLFFSCNSPSNSNNIEENDSAQNTEVKVVKSINFNEDSAYYFVKKQVDFGPRVPGTKEHEACYQFLFNQLFLNCDTVYTQNTTAKTFDNVTIPVKNLIGSFNPKSPKRILISAHWDTRPFADQDQKDKNKPILGANDGASGVGIILQLCQILNSNKIDLGVDFIFFDAEDWGDNSGKVEDSYCLGSQYWAKNPHVPFYKADFGILLDMVGAPNAMFGYEGFSSQNGRHVIDYVWKIAHEAGYQKYFQNKNRGYVTDDHYYIMKYLPHIPVIDIIDFDPNTPSNFGHYWHTHKDNMDAISKETLKAVGQTLLNVLFAY